MEAYTAFAKIYDKFMENVPYEKWGDFLAYIIDKYGISKAERYSSDALESERNLILDMGCGTGILTEIMYNKGYDMIGVDISQEMLDVALRRKLSLSGKADDNSEGILYVCQDMCELDLFSTVGTIYSTCDSVNYLIEDEEIESCFACVSNYLYPGGLFIFDANTVHKYRDSIGDVTIADNAEEGSFIWDNFYDEEENINEYDLTLFIKAEDSDCGGRELYEKFTETHYQRGYEVEELITFIIEAGLQPIAIIDEKCINEEADENKSDYRELLDKAGMDIRCSKGNDSKEQMNVEDIINIGVDSDSERVIFIVRKPE